jgi:hypothetical protein
MCVFFVTILKHLNFFKFKVPMCCRYYTYEEKEALLRYICDNNQYFRLKGNAVWVKMERAGVCPGRTHQSLKEHFKKQLAGELEKSPFLNLEEKELFRKYL